MFERSPSLESNNLALRPMTIGDFEGLFACGGDKKVWQGHPSVDRYQKHNFKRWFSDAIESGRALTIVDKSSNEIIGSTRFYFDETPENEVSIGYTFLAYKCWGGKVNRELKMIMLDYAFNYFSSVWFHVSPDNSRSQNALLKLGAKYIKDKKVSLGGAKPTNWKFYRISHNDWVLSQQSGDRA